MPQQSKTTTQEQLEYYLAVDKLLSAAERVRRQRDRLLEAARSDAPGSAQGRTTAAEPREGQR